MRLFSLICFVSLVFAFDFDENVVTPDDKMVSVSTVTPLLIDNNTATTTTTTETPTLLQEKYIGREVSEIGEKEGTATPTTRPTTAATTPATTTSSFPTKLEVVVTKSMFRLIDEAFRNRLINFESRIASLLAEREKIRDDIETFDPAFDATFFEGAFKTAAVETR